MKKQESPGFSRGEQVNQKGTTVNEDKMILAALVPLVACSVLVLALAAWVLTALLHLPWWGSALIVVTANGMLLERILRFVASGR